MTTLCFRSLALVTVVAAAVAQAQTAIAPRGARPVKPQAAERASQLGAPSLVDGPTLGFVFDPSSSSIRRVEGVPGAANLRESLDSGFQVTRGYPSPQHDYMLAFRSDDRPTLLIMTGGRIGQTVLLEEIRSNPIQVRFSASGNAAILAYEDRSVTLVSGLPLFPRVERTWDLSEHDGMLTLLDVRDTDHSALVAIGLNESSTLLLLSTDSGATVLRKFGKVPSARFRLRTADAVVADSDTGEILASGDLTRSEWTVLANTSDTGLIATEIGIGEDGRYIAVVQRGVENVAWIDTASGSVRTLNCECSPMMLNPLKGKLVYQLTEPGDNRVWYLDGSGDQPKIFVAGTPTKEE